MGFDIILKSVSAEGLVWKTNFCWGQLGQDLCTLLIYTLIIFEYNDLFVQDMIAMKAKVERDLTKHLDSREIKIQDQEQQLKFLQV